MGRDRHPHARLLWAVPLFLSAGLLLGSGASAHQGSAVDRPVAPDSTAYSADRTGGPAIVPARVTGVRQWVRPVSPSKDRLPALLLVAVAAGLLPIVAHQRSRLGRILDPASPGSSSGAAPIFLRAPPLFTVA